MMAAAVASASATRFRALSSVSRAPCLFPECHCAIASDASRCAHDSTWT
jgi:hypothetical protein